MLFNFKKNKKSKLHRTKYLNINNLEDSEYLYIPMDKGLKRIVKIGEKVLIGTELAKSEDVPTLHSPVSGEIVDTVKLPVASGMELKSIVIKNDFNDNVLEKERFPLEDQFDLNNFFEFLHNMGIHGKNYLNISERLKNKKFNYLIINAIEPSIYSNSKNRLIQEKNREIMELIAYLFENIGFNSCLIVIGEDKKEAISDLRKNINIAKIKDIEIVPVKDVNKVNNDLSIIKYLKKGEYKSSTDFLNQGIMMIDISKLEEVYDAIFNNEPVTQKIITVEGDIENPKNIRCKIGTSLRDIFKKLEINVNEIKSVYLDYPLRAKSLISLDTPIDKTSNIIYIKSHVESQEKLPCIRCGQCIEACPRGLMPLNYIEAVKNKDLEQIKGENIMVCCECGNCGFVCPTKRPILEYINLGKHLIKNGEVSDGK